MTDVIDVVGLTKRYGSVAAVDDLSFTVAAGSVFAFLGTNGAGKSTTIGCLTTTTPFDHGTVLVAGEDVARFPRSVRRRIGVVFQESMMDAALTVRENLLTRARLYGMDASTSASRIDELSDLIDLPAFVDRRYGRLSGGQRRRADIARALVHEPSLLFLDEPTAGLDPASRAAVWSTIRLLRERRGLTVFLTTHYMEETEEADEICIIDAGRTIARGSPRRLREAHSRSTLTITTGDAERLVSILRRGGGEATATGGAVTVRIDSAAQAMAVLATHREAIVDFEFRHGRMDDVFLALTDRRGLEVQP
ncbi:ABC transporter ATP-binding protein [Microbacterium sp.]|uniref:ABC transporter ATP-binding protein n=1 Tax=Microbacterium sp. TaxID=51671 RepID=UPI0028114283|nr:ABC transporter ATP-binding protein [Microbacterium sp.]